MKIKLDLTGRRFGRLTAIKPTQKPTGSRDRHTLWLCECDCGGVANVRSDKLTNGYTKSCGCLKNEIATERILSNGKPHPTHGQSSNRLYNIYQHMKARCNNPKKHKYKDYGGRGITVCKEWEDSFQAFYDWAMANGYTEDMSIDRIDVDRGYQPDNCQWLTISENSIKSWEDRKKKEKRNED